MDKPRINKDKLGLNKNEVKYVSDNQIGKLNHCKYYIYYYIFLCYIQSSFLIKTRLFENEKLIYVKKQKMFFTFWREEMREG
jgi:hypothetical protein